MSRGEQPQPDGTAALVAAIVQGVVEALQAAPLVVAHPIRVGGSPAAHDGGVVRAVPSTPRLVDAAELAEVLSVGVDFVYEHAAELGAIPLTDGERPRLRFDVEKTIAALSARSGGVRSQAPVEPVAASIRGGRRRASMGASGDLLPIRGERAA